MALYLIHFDEPFSHAKHYLGFCDDGERSLEAALEQRVSQHYNGRGSRLLAHVTAAGIPWRVTRVWEGGSRDFERSLKQHGKARICPACVGERAYNRAKILQPV